MSVALNVCSPGHMDRYQVLLFFPALVHDVCLSYHWCLAPVQNESNISDIWLLFEQRWTHWHKTSKHKDRKDLITVAEQAETCSGVANSIPCQVCLLGISSMGSDTLLFIFWHQPLTCSVSEFSIIQIRIFESEWLFLLILYIWSLGHSTIPTPLSHKSTMWWCSCFPY